MLQPKVLVGVPVKNCAQFIRPMTEQIMGLQWPMDRIDVAFLINDCDDDSEGECSEAAARMTARGINACVSTTSCGFRLPHTMRHHAEFHEDRNAALCALRQAIVDRHMTDQHDFVLWFDADFIGIPADTVRRVVDADMDALAFVLTVKDGIGTSVYDLTTLRAEPTDRPRVSVTSEIIDGLVDGPVKADILNGAMAIHRRVFRRTPMPYMAIRQSNMQEGPHVINQIRLAGFTKIGIDPGIVITHASITGQDRPKSRSTRKATT